MQSSFYHKAVGKYCRKIRIHFSTIFKFSLLLHSFIFNWRTQLNAFCLNDAQLFITIICPQCYQFISIITIPHIFVSFIPKITAILWSTRHLVTGNTLQIFFSCHLEMNIFPRSYRRNFIRENHENSGLIIINGSKYYREIIQTARIFTYSCIRVLLLVEIVCFILNK